MIQFAKDFGRGVLFALPVMAVMALGAREMLRLREDSRRVDARRLEAERRAETAEQMLASQLRRSDEALADRLRGAADAAESQGAAEERLTQVIDFLKSEVSSAETTIRGLQQEPGTRPAPAADRVSQLLKEISRLNSEIEALHAERDHWRKQAQPR
jgi:chromosome segregation ATPase